MDPHLYVLIERWAADEMRSVNGHMEYLLREALKKAGRLTQEKPTEPPLPANPTDDDYGTG
ncbi:hypothetical protein [Heliophilum fasciatum]|uniref:hypothetical protein n=1 Tax=Heliophilum fasciatum TaxID=35700 RepID=UPI003873AEA6|nr:hypothetical protein [Heliophilum fasciatum]